MEQGVTEQSGTHHGMAERYTLKPFFEGDSYDTPADNRRDLLDRLCCGGSFWFHVLNSRVILESRSHALNNRYDTATWARNSHDVLRALERCGARFHISGLDHMRQATGPLVFISNHMGTTETQVLPCLIAPIMPVTFIVKRSLMTMPFFGPIMRARDPVTVGRDNPREDMVTVMTQGVRKLQSGTSLIVFPEATRQKRFKPDQFNSLGVKLARRAGVQAMPIAVKTDFWRPGGPIKDLGRLDRSQPIHIEFGEAMTVEGNGREQHGAVVEFIRSRLVTWGGAVE